MTSIFLTAARNEPRARWVQCAHHRGQLRRSRPKGILQRLPHPALGWLRGADGGPRRGGREAQPGDPRLRAAWRAAERKGRAQDPPRSLRQGGQEPRLRLPRHGPRGVRLGLGVVAVVLASLRLRSHARGQELARWPVHMLWIRDEGRAPALRRQGGRRDRQRQGGLWVRESRAAKGTGGGCGCGGGGLRERASLYLQLETWRLRYKYYISI